MLLFYVNILSCCVVLLLLYVLLYALEVRDFWCGKNWVSIQILRLYLGVKTCQCIDMILKTNKQNPENNNNNRNNSKDPDPMLWILRISNWFEKYL